MCCPPIFREHLMIHMRSTLTRYSRRVKYRAIGINRTDLRVTDPDPPGYAGGVSGNPVGCLCFQCHLMY